MRTVSTCSALACAFGLASVLLAPPPADAQLLGVPDGCSINGTAGTCSGNQSGGIFADDAGLTSLAISNLSAPISPNPGTIGVAYFSSFFATPATPSTNGFFALPLTINIDGTAVINVTTAHATDPTTAGAQGIAVFTTGGNGTDGIIQADNTGGPGGAGGGGGDVTINNQANITADSTARAVESRAVEFGETGELNSIPGDIATLEGLIGSLPSPSQDPLDYFFDILAANNASDGNTINPSTQESFIASMQQAITNMQARAIYLSGVPSVDQTSQAIYGAISVQSVGGNGGVGVGFYPFFPVGNGGDGGAGGAITITNSATIEADGPLVAGIYALSVGGHGGQAQDPQDGGPGIPGYGFGGHGGAGGAISIANNGTITTTGDSSPGIFAESLGGQSGDGGPVGESDPNYVFPAGSGGLVTVSNAGTISTSGASAYGIFAESVGGLGLSGGDAKPGGEGGQVVVEVSGQITTTGLSAYGVFARSVGGNGGNGSDEEDGGPGGASNLVTVTVDKSATISTSGTSAIGVFAQSIGGEGGFGGSGDNIFYSDAGGGGNGGQGGDVVIGNAGTITTSGAFAYGMFGQALGGAGGFGGSASGLVSESGGGGGGTGAGSVTATNSGVIVTTGIGANALYAQSVAGQGGDAGNAGGFVSLGSDGGSGAAQACANDPTQCLNGGAIVITNTGKLITQGNSATAIFAQSIGGGGGNGGGSSGVFSFGGDGGAGGNGGAVQVTNGTNGQIDVFGSNAAMGIFAESIGGGGGSGGDALSAGTSLNMSIGGSGGSGGMGGDVTVTNNGVITLNGFNDTAIFVQSVGGGGGNGGDATSIGAGITPASLAIGGTGGGGGNGGDVVVTNAGVINTTGDFSNAIFAQSVGGGGGHGGAAYTVSLAAGGGDIPAVSAAVSIGGNGGDGGTGGEVDVSNSGSISTLDWNAMGIFAQSVGGSGGDGGSSSARAMASAPDGFSFTFSLAVGGNGGNGNFSGPVYVTNTGEITTFGDLSPAVFVQSVGGSGGNGGDASAVSASLLSKNSADIDISVGGNGGTGGNGSTASVTNSGTIITMGAMSPGITAQSVGGGGGNGGDGEQGELIPGEGDFIPPQADADGQVNDALKKLLDYQNEDAGEKEGAGAFGKDAKEAEKGDKGPDSFGFSLAIGGQGGAGGDGMLAYVDNTGSVTTLGWMSDGVFAQSVGGGGGSGGDGSAMGSDAVSGAVAIGGKGGASGIGGTVNVFNEGDITTYGDISYGIRAQSVGGGGGAGGEGSGSSTINPGNFSLSLSVGGSGGAGGNGGSVLAKQTGSIVTLGTGSIGIFAQSVGGGGGDAGAGNADEFNVDTIGVGGSTGSNGDGLDVTVKLISGSITTAGDYAHGIFAQSVGGGGGIVGEVPATALVESDPFGGMLPSGTPVPYSLGTIESLPLFNTFVGIIGGSPPVGCDVVFTDPFHATGASSCGNGGPVDVQTTGTITTYGKNAAGIFAQSIGGGGGVGSKQTPGVQNPLLNGPLSLVSGGALISSNGGIGTGGTVTVNHNGSIFATGENSIGIFAQSMNGAANITSTGTDGRGASITVTVNGTIEGGSGSGAGVFMSGGDQNTLTNNVGGDIFALSGLAIIASDGDDTVYNYATITGSVGLGAGTNAFINEQGSLFEPGPIVYIGPGNALTNSGTLSPGGVGNIATTTIVGNYTQTPTGIFLVDVNFTTGQSDNVTVEGNASLAGKVVLGPLDITTIKPGQFFTVLTVANGGTLTNNGISIDNTLTVDYGVKFVGQAFEVGVTSVQFNLGAGMLTPKEQVVSNNLQAIWAAGGGNMSGILNYLAGLTDPTAYQTLLNHLNPTPILNNNTQSLIAGGNAVNILMSCPGTESAYDALREHECFWARGSGGTAHRSSTTTTPSFDTSSYEYAMGGQFEVAPTWFVGLSADIAQSVTSVETLAHESTQSANAGVVVKHEMGDWLVALALDGEFGWNRFARFVDFPTPNTTASSSPTDALLNGRLRLAYLASWGDAYFKPEIAVDGYYASTSQTTEEGAGPIDMIIAATNKTFASGTVGFEAGLLEAFHNGGSMRPYVGYDLTAYTDNSWDAAARFAGAPAGAPGFALHDTFPSVIERLAGGLEFNLDGGSLRFEYEHRFGARYFDQTGSLKVRIPL